MRSQDCLLLKDERGVVLIMALVLMGLLAALASAYAYLVRADTVLSGAASRARSGFYAAEAGLNVGMVEFSNIFKKYGVPGEGDYEERTVSVGNRTVYYELEPVPGYDPCTEGEDVNCYTTIPAGQKYAGLNSIPYRYTVKSTSVNSEGDEEAQLGAEFDVHNIPIFQFLAFYANDLEILPGPNMNLTGRIHTNNRLYLNSNNTMTIGDRLTDPVNRFVQVTAAQGVYRGRKNDSSCGGHVIIDKLEDVVAPSGDYDPLELGCEGGSSQIPQETLDLYKGSVDGEEDDMDIPSVSTIARDEDGIFWSNADLRIVLRLDLARAVVPFSALCPATATTPAAPDSPALFPIEVQDANGARDVAKTNSLWTFMCQQRGAIFYTDVPTTAAAGTASDTIARDPANYAPSFGGVNGSAGGDEQRQPAYTAGMTPISDYRVYRRVGYDTNGDGTINTTDWNPDVCPVSLGGVAAATKPWWAPAYCSWPSSTTTQTLWYKDTDYRRGGYYNHREGKWMYLLNVNVRALIEWNAQNGDPLFPHDDNTDWGLVFFLSVQGQNSLAATNNYGVRVFDSADLDTRDVTFPTGQSDPTGLTVVSDQATYIEGNYNYYPTQTTAQKYPAAVIGDSLNVLSQSWERTLLSGGNRRGNDRKSLNTFTYRQISVQDDPCGVSCTANSFSSATGLGINAAFIANVDNTAGSSYNGGLENYPRFHEDWSNGSRTLVYRGSYVSLGTPQHVNGSWSYGGPVYTAPQRNWDYDASFNEVEFLPPLTPTVTYVQQRMYTRFYE
jgi:hypothetical protein